MSFDLNAPSRTSQSMDLALSTAMKSPDTAVSNVETAGNCNIEKRVDSDLRPSTEDDDEMPELELCSDEEVCFLCHEGAPAQLPKRWPVAPGSHWIPLFIAYDSAYVLPARPADLQRGERYEFPKFYQTEPPVAHHFFDGEAVETAWANQRIEPKSRPVVVRAKL
ncbi:hypothetical protein B0H16DRAFT_1708933 [Mycena metata]|uniref:Uncharacterized protein n=1 Tax=Mycena metata TaxID=1033252 RepID=A0AAD7KF23_9AGAR|nr:hypothetical protein B0H16DRAFT_1708933 [Mycena metata]